MKIKQLLNLLHHFVQAISKQIVSTLVINVNWANFYKSQEDNRLQVHSTGQGAEKPSHSAEWLGQTQHWASKHSAA